MSEMWKTFCIIKGSTARKEPALVNLLSEQGFSIRLSQSSQGPLSKYTHLEKGLTR